MGITARGGDFKAIDEGVHAAVCVALYDIGTHYNETFNKSVHQVIVTWEIPGQRDDDDKPRLISKTYTMSLGKKANLRKDLETWRGKAFSQEELDGFDITRLLGAPCMVQVIHNERNGKTYANIQAVMSLIKGIDRPTAQRKPVFFTFEEQMDIPADTPEWIEERIKTSEEWAAKNKGALPPVQPDLETDLEPF